jgi:hypothetical protein
LPTVSGRSPPRSDCRPPDSCATLLGRRACRPLLGVSAKALAPPDWRSRRELRLRAEESRCSILLPAPSPVPTNARRRHDRRASETSPPPDSLKLSVSATEVAQATMNRRVRRCGAPTSHAPRVPHSASNPRAARSASTSRSPRARNPGTFSARTTAGRSTAIDRAKAGQSHRGSRWASPLPATLTG